MGRQVNLYLHPDDFTEFREKLDYKDEIVFLAGIQRRSLLATQDNIRYPKAINEQQELYVYICRAKDINYVQLRKRSYADYFVVDINRSNAIEFHMPYLNGNILKRGRLYFTTGYWSENDSWNEKSEDFKKWGDRILRKARNFCTVKVKGGFATSKVVDWKNKTGGKLAQI